MPQVVTGHVCSLLNTLLKNGHVLSKNMEHEEAPKRGMEVYLPRLPKK